MRKFNSLLTVLALAAACIATSVSATTVKGRIITLEYQGLSTIGSPFSDDPFLEGTDRALIQIRVNEGYTDQLVSGGSVNRIRDTSGTIRVFRKDAAGTVSADYIQLGGNGVEIQVRDGSIRFGSRNRSSGNTSTGETFMALGTNVNSLTSSEGLFGTDYATALAVLAAGDYDGSKRLRIRTNTGSGIVNNLQTGPSGLVSVTVSTVPLPAGAWLLLGGVGIMALRRKRAA